MQVWNGKGDVPEMKPELNTHPLSQNSSQQITFHSITYHLSHLLTPWHTLCYNTYSMDKFNTSDYGKWLEMENRGKESGEWPTFVDVSKLARIE